MSGPAPFTLSSSSELTLSNRSEHLTIRIPNPKDFFARQSQWISHRGKARCDHCRENHLKCDRVRPYCNHCPRASGRTCTYTLPTAHNRGRPRCDRCRMNDIKCDRAVPLCNGCSESDVDQCIYTPSKRPRDHSQVDAQPHQQQQSHLEALESTEFTDQSSQESSSDDESEAMNSGNSQVVPSPSSSHDQPEMPTRRGIADFRRYLDLGARPLAPPMNPQPPIPWGRANIYPYPPALLQGLSWCVTTEVPYPATFNDALSHLLDNLESELKQTACLPLDAYTKLWNYLRGNTGLNTEGIKHLVNWAGLHRICLGSEDMIVLMQPCEIDSQISTGSKDGDPRITIANLTLQEQSKAANPQNYERLPIREQVYDILTAAHAFHCNPIVMLSNIKQLGFGNVTWTMAELYTRLCPVCTSPLRATQASQGERQPGFYEAFGDAARRYDA